MKEKETKEVNAEVRPEVKFEHYDEARLVIHCNKCNTLTQICYNDGEGNVNPIIVSGALDLNKLVGGPMPTDNHSRLPLYCDTCKTMLTLCLAPVGTQEENLETVLEKAETEEGLSVDVISEDAENITVVAEGEQFDIPKEADYTPKLEIVK